MATLYVLYPGSMVTISERPPAKEVLTWSSAWFDKRLGYLYFSLREVLYVTAENMKPPVLTSGHLDQNNWIFSLWLTPLCMGWTGTWWLLLVPRAPNMITLLFNSLSLICIHSVFNKCFPGSCWVDCSSFVSPVVLLSGPLKLLCAWTVSHCTLAVKETYMYHLREVEC